VFYSNKKKVLIWADIGNNLDVSVPNVDGTIRIKVLKLPKGVKTKKPVQLEQPKVNVIHQKQPTKMNQPVKAE
jgi:hypothetical protein